MPFLGDMLVPWRVFQMRTLQNPKETTSPPCLPQGYYMLLLLSIENSIQTESDEAPASSMKAKVVHMDFSNTHKIHVRFYTYMGLISMVNVGEYTQNGSYGIHSNDMTWVEFYTLPNPSQHPHPTCGHSTTDATDEEDDES